MSLESLLEREQIFFQFIGNMVLNSKSSKKTDTLLQSKNIYLIKLFSLSLLLYTDQNGLFQCFLEWHSLTDMCARPLYKYLFKIWSRLTEKYKNCLKQGKTKNWLTPFHDQTERGSGLLVSVSPLGAQRNSTRKTFPFYPPKTNSKPQILQRLCPIALY